MKKYVFPSFLFIALLFTSCMNNGTNALRSDNFEEKSIILEPFTGISVSEGIEVILHQGDTHRAEAKSNFMEYLLVEVNDEGILRIHFDKPSFTNFSNDQTFVEVWGVDVNQFKASSAGSLKVDGTFKNDIQTIKVSSAGNIDYDVNTINLTVDASSAGKFEGTIEVDELIGSASSSGSINIKGSAKNAMLKASSAGSVNAKELNAEKVDAKASSSGSVSVYVIEELNAKASSSGSVKYATDSNIKTNIDTSTSGKVHKLN